MPSHESGNHVAIDRADRERTADAIERYLRCEIDNFALDNIFFNAKDRAAFEIACEMWFFYDDCTRHKNEGGRKLRSAAEARMRRWVQFLRSDSPWPIDEPDPRLRGGWMDRLPKLLRWPLAPLVVLVAIPLALFHRPCPRCGANEYWPFASDKDWNRWQAATFGAAG